MTIQIISWQFTEKEESLFYQYNSAAMNKAIHSLAHRKHKGVTYILMCVENG